MNSTGGLEVLCEVRVGRNVEENSSFSGEISCTGRFRVQVDCESCRLNMDRSDDAIAIGSTDVAVLDERIFGTLQGVLISLLKNPLELKADGLKSLSQSH